MKLPKLKRGVAGALLVCISAGASVAFAQPTSTGHLFKYKNIGVRNLAPTYAPFAAQAVAGLSGRFNFVASNGTGTAPPYFNESTQTGDVLLLEGSWGIIDQYAWAGFATFYNEINGNYLSCNNDNGSLIIENCNSTNKKARFAMIRFNNDAVNALWSDSNKWVNKNQIVNGHKITIDDIRQHLIAHEFGHVIGMDHEATVCYSASDIDFTQQTLSTSVMEAGAFCNPLFTGYQSPDITWISGKY